MIEMAWKKSDVLTGCLAANVNQHMLFFFRAKKSANNVSAWLWRWYSQFWFIPNFWANLVRAYWNNDLPYPGHGRCWSAHRLRWCVLLHWSWLPCATRAAWQSLTEESLLMSKTKTEIFVFWSSASKFLSCFLVSCQETFKTPRYRTALFQLCEKQFHPFTIGLEMEGSIS